MVTQRSETRRNGRCAHAACAPRVPGGWLFEDSHRACPAACTTPSSPGTPATPCTPACRPQGRSQSSDSRAPSAGAHSSSALGFRFRPHPHHARQPRPAAPAARYPHCSYACGACSGCWRRCAARRTSAGAGRPGGHRARSTQLRCTFWGGLGPARTRPFPPSCVMQRRGWLFLVLSQSNLCSALSPSSSSLPLLSLPSQHPALHCQACLPLHFPRPATTRLRGRSPTTAAGACGIRRTLCPAAPPGGQSPARGCA